MEETFSPSHDMAEYMSGYWKWGKLLGNKTLVRTWTVIGESRLVQLLRNVYDRKTQHQSKGSTFKQTKSEKGLASFSLFFYKFINHLF